MGRGHIHIYIYIYPQTLWLYERISQGADSLKIGHSTKLDGVGPVDNRPSTALTNFFWKIIFFDVIFFNMWHVTGDTWHVTGDRRQVTCDTWHIVWDEHSHKNFSSLALPVLNWQCIEDILGKGWLTDRLNHKPVFRAAPATPGLLTTSQHINTVFKKKVLYQIPHVLQMVQSGPHHIHVGKFLWILMQSGGQFLH